ncbi:MAG TPA: hypothetical protein DCE44_02510 [Verrucomicrobiales bacterium]|nr:hypothetical protein [Verrucomicrobiales bacterium]
MNALKALIIGGGIGGHTLAVALEKLGIASEIFERAPKAGEVGAGLGLWANAVSVLDRLGIVVRDLGLPLLRGEGVSWRGGVLTKFDLQSVSAEAGADSYIVHRGELLDAIAARVSPGTVRAGKECVRLEQSDHSVLAYFKDGSSAEGDLLIGADGIHSTVRSALWGYTPVRYSGQTCYRGIAPLAPLEPQVLREILGRGQRCGICPLDRHRLYWWAALNRRSGEVDVPGDRRDFLLTCYRGWPHAIEDFIAATPPESILRKDLIYRKPIPRWSRGCVTLLGDAAHPTTPNLGQGACMAIEDAEVLAHAIASQSNIESVFCAYEARRVARTTAVTNDSWRYGQLARWQNPFAVTVRELIFRATPSFVVQRSLRRNVCPVAFRTGPP